MIFCARRGEERSFDDSEFVHRDGLVLHVARPPAHTADGDDVVLENGAYRLRRSAIPVPLKTRLKRLHSHFLRPGRGDKHGPQGTG